MCRSQPSKNLKKGPQVAKVIPISLGDSFRGFRIVGTSLDYIKHYDAQLASGALWARPMQAVIGSQIAGQTGLKVGDAFAGSHGLAAGEMPTAKRHARWWACWQAAARCLTASC